MSKRNRFGHGDPRVVIVAILAVVAIVVAAAMLRQPHNDELAPPTFDPDSSSSTQPPPTLNQFGEDTYVAGNVHTGSTVITEEEWQRAIRSVTQLENDLFAKPDPARVGELALSTCDCYADTVRRLTALKTNNQHVAGPTLRVQSASLVQVPAPNQVDLIVTLIADGFPTVDANGNVIETGPSGLLPPNRYILDKGSDGRWRIAQRHAFDN